MKDSVLVEKSKDFAKRIVFLTQAIKDSKKSMFLLIKF